MIDESEPSVCSADEGSEASTTDTATLLDFLAEGAPTFRTM